MHGADRNRMAAVTAGAYRFGQPVVADLYITVFIEDVAGLEVAVNNTAFMEERQALGDLAQEESRFLCTEPPPVIRLAIRAAKAPRRTPL